MVFADAPSFQKPNRSLGYSYLRTLVVPVSRLPLRVAGGETDIGDCILVAISPSRRDGFVGGMKWKAACSGEA